MSAFSARATLPRVGPIPAAKVAASSHRDGDAPGQAVDGDLSTAWRAEAVDEPASLTVDLGGRHRVEKIQQTFADDDVWRFVVEGSIDGEEWAVLVDRAAGRPGRTFADGVTGVYRQLRLRVLGSAGGHAASSVDFRVVGSKPGTDPVIRELAAGTKALSSSLQPGHEPFRAVDDDPRTAWRARETDTPQTLTVDLGTAALVRRVEQSFEHRATWPFRIDVSRDGERWVSAVDHADGAAGQAFAVEVSGSYRFVRLTVTGPSGAGHAASSSGLKVFGIGSPVRTRWWEDRSGVARFFPVWQRLTLDDIRAQLDTLKAQGHNAIELAPIFEGYREVWAGLGVTDLYNVHPDVGTFADLDRLLEAAHDRDMKIIFFANPGYAHDSAPFFRKALRDFRDGIDSAERCWFDIRPEPGPYDRWVHNEEFGAYYWARWDDAAPSFDFAKQCWRDEVRKYIAFWMDKGFDGIVFDAPDVYHQTTLEFNNEAITDVTGNYDTFVNAEGSRDRSVITDWHYNSLQDYTITQWAIPPNPGSSRLLDAIDSGNPDALESVLRGYRDEMVEAGGITQTPPNWGRRDYPVDKRLLEIATLTTMGTLFYVHNDYFTINPNELDFPHWTDDQLDTLHTLMKVQSSYAALAPSGQRVKLPTNDDTKFYAFVRTNKNASVKALVVLNFQPTGEDISVDLTDVDINTDQVPIDLMNGVAAAPITSASHTIHVAGRAAAILAVD